MAGIAGIALPGRQQDVVKMLGKLSHRGNDRAKMLEKRDVTMQAAWHEVRARPMPLSLQMNAVWDGVSAPFPQQDSLSRRTEPFALAAASAEGLFLARDMLGVKPLYYGKLEGSMAFASEVKALLTVTDDVHEFPPGTWYTPEGGFKSFRKIKTGKLPYSDVNTIAAGLRLKLEEAIIRRVVADEMGTWLSGGVDSSAIAALARLKAKFWQGAGVQELLSDYAESIVRDADFQRERVLSNGWKLNSKEELMYYRIFKEHFGELAQLDWMGRTKGAPVQ